MTTERLEYLIEVLDFYLAEVHAPGEALQRAVENYAKVYHAREIEMEESLLDKLQFVLKQIQEVKPNDRSSTDRRYAIVITMLEQVIAYFAVYIDGEVN